MKEKKKVILLIIIQIILIIPEVNSYVGFPSFNEADWEFCFDDRIYPVNFNINYKSSAWEIIGNECARKPDDYPFTGNSIFNPGMVTNPTIYKKHETSCPRAGGGFWNTADGMRLGIYGTGNACCSTEKIKVDEDEDGNQDDTIIRQFPFLVQEKLCCSIGDDLSQIYSIPDNIKMGNAACCPIMNQYAQASPSVRVDATEKSNIVYDTSKQGCCIQENEFGKNIFFGVFDLETERCCSNLNGWDSDKWKVTKLFTIPPNTPGEDCCLNEDGWQKGDKGSTSCDRSNGNLCCKVNKPRGIPTSKPNWYWECRQPKECSRCCACGVYHEVGGQDDICYRLEAQLIKCREKYDFPTPNDDVCEVMANEFEGVNNPKGRYQTCLQEEEKYPNMVEKASFYCDKSSNPPPSKNQCPLFALIADDIPDSWCGKGCKSEKIDLGGADCGGHNFFRCICPGW